MRIASAIAIALMTLSMMVVLDAGCEAFVDTHKSVPALFFVADAISPLWFTYLLLPVMTGLMRWYSGPLDPASLVLIILWIASTIVLVMALGAIMLLDGPRETQAYRYIGNALVVALAAYWLRYSWKERLKVRSDPE